MNRLAAVARGDFYLPADLVIHNARVANVYSLTYEQADVAVFWGKIAGIGEGYTAANTFDAAIPSMIDGQIRILKGGKAQ